MAAAGGRRCARGKRCVDSEQDAEGALVGALLDRPEGLCRACEDRLERTVRQLPADVGVLDELIGDFGTVPGPHVRRSRELPLNIRPGIEALRSEIVFEAEFWAEALDMQTPVTVEHWAGGEFLVAVRLGTRVARAAEWLGPRVDALLALGPQFRTAWTAAGEPLRDAWGDREVVERTGLDGALKLFALHARVRQVSGRTKLVHRLTPCCPYCDQPTLVRHNGGDVVECENPACDKKIKERHYDWFVEVTIREERRRQAAVA